MVHPEQEVDSDMKSKSNRIVVNIIKAFVVCGVGVCPPPSIPLAPQTAAAAESFTDIQQYAFTLLQFQRMLHLQEADAQQELKLTKPQIRAFHQEGPEVKRLSETLQSIPAADLEATIRRQFVPQAEKYQQLIDGELDDAQESQLLRRVVQKQPGAIVLLFPGVPEHLQLTAKQRDGIGRIINANLKAHNTNGFKNNPIELLKLARRAAQSRQAAESLLTAEQQAQWKALTKN